jgi:MoaA/NifB/PqqE/SkfB family radical SAM enzyme
MKVIKNKIFFEIERIKNFYYFLLNKKKIENKLRKIFFGLSVETTNICNANCNFCAYQYQKRGMGIMDFELYKKIINEYSLLGGGNLGLTPTVGDPFADKLFLERVKYARKFSNIKKIGIYSNLISLKKFGIENIVKSGLSNIVVSTSGFDPEMYKRVYRSNEYNRMYSNLIDLIEINKNYNSPIKISISMRSDRNIKETTNFKDYQKLIKIIPESEIDFKFRYDNWAGKINQSDLSGIMKLRNRRMTLRLSTCSEFYSGPHIYWNGDVGICGCRDVDAKELIIGNVKTENIKNIWYNKKHLNLMDEFLKNPKKICQNCTHYNNISIFNNKENKENLKNLKNIY